MKMRAMKILSVLVMVALVFVGNAMADTELQRITAEQAFNAVQTQTDPTSGEAKKVMLVDVRTRAEFFWVGAPCAVKSITLDNEKTITPDLGKAHLIKDGREVLIKIKGKILTLPTSKIQSVDLTPIAVNIPLKLWDEQTAGMYLNEGFQAAVEALALEQGAQVVIFYCRSGGRSEACVATFDKTLFEAVYEIDQPNLEDGYGGFEGTSYSNAFLGYRGFPRRDTRSEDNGSVSWKDYGLPIKTGVNPLAQ